MSRQIETFSGPDELANAFAAFLADWIRENQSDQSFLNIALSGGSTPKLLFQKLAQDYADNIPWHRVQFFWGDERCVPPDSPESNYGEAQRLLLEHLDLPAGQVFRVRGEDAPAEEASRYSETIQHRLPANQLGVPVFDLMLLGMGDDGHTASIFPDQMALLTSNQVCEVATHPQSGQQRVTLTGPVINASRLIVFLIAGKNKASILSQIINQTDGCQQFPAAHIDGDRLVFFLDAAAASEL